MRPGLHQTASLKKFTGYISHVHLVTSSQKRFGKGGNFSRLVNSNNLARLNESLFIFFTKPPSLKQIKAKSTVVRFDWLQNNVKNAGTVQRVEEGRRADGAAAGSR